MSNTTLATTTTMSGIFAALQSIRLEADLPLHILAESRCAAMGGDIEEAMKLASEAQSPVARQRYLALAAEAGSDEAKELLNGLHQLHGTLAPSSGQVDAILSRRKKAQPGVYSSHIVYDEDDLAALTMAAHAGNQVAQLALANDSCFGINGEANPADGCLWAQIARSGTDETLAAEAQQVICQAFEWLSTGDSKELPGLMGYWEVAGEEAK